MLGEAMSAVQVAGGAVVLVGVGLAETARRARHDLTGMDTEVVPGLGISAGVSATQP